MTDEPKQESRRSLAWSLAAGIALVLAPTLVFVVGGLLGPGGASGAFRATLFGLVVAAAVGAFATGIRRRALLLLPSLGLVAGLVHGLAQGGGSQGLALGLLYVAVATAAAGIAALGRCVRAPDVSASAVAAILLWTAMAGLYWADAIAEHLPRTERRSFRQAVLHVDPSLALAYDGVGFDRLRAPEVYFTVPLASSLFERPRASTTAGLWLAVGLLAGAGGKWGRRRSTAGREGG